MSVPKPREWYHVDRRHVLMLDHLYNLTPSAQIFAVAYVEHLFRQPWPAGSQLTTVPTVDRHQLPALLETPAREDPPAAGLRLVFSNGHNVPQSHPPGPSCRPGEAPSAVALQSDEPIESSSGR